MTARSKNAPPRKRLTPAQRDEIVFRYERGEAFGPELAETFGVHRNTVYSLLKRRGAVKASRIDEAMAPIIAELDERRRQAQRAQQVKDRLWIERANEMMRPVDEMMKALVQADRDGTMQQFGRDLRAAQKAG